VLWQVGDDIEVSFNIKTEVLVELSLLRLLWILVNIDKIPLLADLSCLLSVHLDVSVL
jgi:hypothetical protein